MTNEKIPDPPVSVARDNGAHLELWKAIWAVRTEVSVDLASLKAEFRILAAIITAIAFTILGIAIERGVF